MDRGSPVSQTPEPTSAQTGAFGMPKPEGWPLERLLNLLAGSAVLATLALGRVHSRRWRVLTGLIGANLVVNATLGWCPTSVVLHRLGVPTASEQASARVLRQAP
jgi:hypothetical protein